MGVSDTVGDTMIYDIWSDGTKRTIQKSAIRSADPNRGGTPNLRVQLHKDLTNEEPEIVEPSNILDNPSLLCPKPPPLKLRFQTNKHKVKWHDAQEPPSDFVESKNNFGPKITTNDLDRSHKLRRKKLV